MARLSKDCPTCGGKRPVNVELVPGAPAGPSATAQYRVTCRGCGFVHPPDGPTMQKGAEISTWLTKHRADAKTAKVARRAVVPLGPRPL